MRTLTLLRHAKSGWDDPVQRDFDRPLNAKGFRGARMMGEHCRREGLAWDHVISSPAVRCIETLDGFWEGYGKTLKPVWDRRVYLASCVHLLDVLNEAPPEAQSLLMCGHNPGMEDLALMLTPDDGDAIRDSVEDKFPTGSIAVLAFEGEWADLAARSARLEKFVRPRDLDPALGPGPG
ncbi:putative phosphohistidine phosphatase SixA [Sphingomonas changbaiensis NBRC 104936]|uniref:Putative phosphohistidine phosphatase SixA n=1 Tax=Sphingomonas changbaiensis NBRC 104936 TaxID=1219043 RepID=A0A0E9MSW9_9SPHN|nr:histidine phosphatase family protein [Sphingomonas changbaiensis]GAO40230.1 putative phosphohistidine phosphatase SixA [Sphingomonas changbaiensis NBRC 104936]